MTAIKATTRLEAVYPATVDAPITAKTRLAKTDVRHAQTLYSHVAPSKAALGLRPHQVPIAAYTEAAGQPSVASVAATLASAQFAITSKARRRTLEDLYLAGQTLLLRVAEYQASPNAQVHAEIVAVYQDLTSRIAKERGVFMLKNAAPTPPADFAAGLSLASHPATGKQTVVEVHGEVAQVLNLESLVAQRQQALQSVISVVPQELRALSDSQLSRLRGKVTYVALEDDSAQPLARVFPTRWVRIRGGVVRRRVICQGPFRGIYLDVLAHAQAASQTLVPDTRVTLSRVKVRGQKVERLFTQIPYEPAWTPVRRALRRLAALDPNIVYVRQSKNTAFYMPVESYGVVRDVLGSLALGPAAQKAIDQHFAILSQQEAARTPVALSQHSAKAIGGFRRAVAESDGTLVPFAFNAAQQEGLSWLAARNFRGVMALDTGLGKTLVAVGAFLALKKRHGEQRPFLVVAPPALRGTFIKEIYRFLDEQEAQSLLAQTVILSYGQFAEASKTGELLGKPFDAKRFGAVVFDEAQWLNKLSAKRTQAALAFKHPRTVCLSASPMEKSPMETYVMACVANGVNLTDPSEGKEHRWRMRKFKDMVCQTLGGRILGVKQEVELLPGVVIDPKTGLYNWVRQNVFYASKASYAKLPKLRQRTEALPMGAGMEQAYRKRSQRLLTVLSGMVALYRDQGRQLGPKGAYIDAQGRVQQRMHPLAQNRRLKAVFGPKFKKALLALNALGNNTHKTRRAADLIFGHLATQPQSRAVLFTDAPAYVPQAAQELSAQIPAKVHAACTASEVRLFRNGVELTEYAGHRLPLTARSYQGQARKYAVHEWQQFVLGELLALDPEVTTTTLLGPVYQHGQNLQWANVGFHLDRDTWNSENLKQREARLWRQGQTREVTFHTLDWVFRKPRNEFDRTLDEIRSYVDSVGEALFRDVIVAAQHAPPLGSEWPAVRKASALRLDAHLVRLGLAPTLWAVATHGVQP